ncbi:MAG TPA: hypothetical protein VF432_09150 [Thermoanaerobaculia bacterium]
MLDFAFLIWLLGAVAGSPSGSPSPQPVDFTHDVRPILERRCQPCHFPGGKMHAKLPFDKPETIDQLGERLFSRIKKDEEQAVIRAFLARR